MLILLVAASGGVVVEGFRFGQIGMIRRELFGGDPAYLRASDLAALVYMFVAGVYLAEAGDNWIPAEAAQLLAEGWTP